MTITKETWKETYLSKLRESRETRKPLSEITKSDPVWMKSHEISLSDNAAMTPKQIHDLEEETYDPNWGFFEGSNMDTRSQPGEVAMHEHNMLEAWDYDTEVPS